MKVIWNRQLVPVAERTGMLSPVQFGNQQGRTALDALLLKVVTMDCLCLFRLNGAILNSDATARYDCMIPEVSSLHLQSSGLPNNTTKCSVLLNHNMKHHVKMKARVTKEFYKHEPNDEKFGEDQEKCVAKAYVSNTDCTYVDQQDQAIESPTCMQNRLKKIEQVLENLIFGSRGQLSHDKTYWWLIWWIWENGKA
eukprot:14052776-Ditylum_brightwellii.AAC.1